MEVVRSVPSGGNWQDIPDYIIAKSARLTQIKKSGGRTTYYGRLSGEYPSYTINTYFNRPGNGTFIHPVQHRLISLREAARLQSFPDEYIFGGSMTSQFKQIGNAVPPLLAKMIGKSIKKGRSVDLFCGAGGLSEGLVQAGHKILIACDWNANMCESYVRNHQHTKVIQVNMNDSEHIVDLIDLVESELRGRTLNLLAGGPPCQGFSTAGKWQPSDIRNSLLFQTLDIIQHFRPNTVLLENVPGIRSLQKGLILEKFVNALQSYGYFTDIILLKAEEYGVPQLRRRVFIIANTDGYHFSKPTGLLAPVMQGRKKHESDLRKIEQPPPISVNEAISDMPPISSGQGDDVIDYDASWIETDYQRLMRGIISVDEFFKNRAE
ncbi:DNA cytosine methyltransferase [Candidatus Thorarchaeota archaeon]|nr:MAG: DNA cytosine methyltransferase [Candidatus Thorarchaeota archaeon]